MKPRYRYNWRSGAWEAVSVWNTRPVHISTLTEIEDLYSFEIEEKHRSLCAEIKSLLFRFGDRYKSHKRVKDNNPNKHTKKTSQGVKKGAHGYTENMPAALNCCSKCAGKMPYL